MYLAAVIPPQTELDLSRASQYGWPSFEDMAGINVEEMRALYTTIRKDHNKFVKKLHRRILDHMASDEDSTGSEDDSDS